jgi:hypothetical protein
MNTASLMSSEGSYETSSSISPTNIVDDDFGENDDDDEEEYDSSEENSLASSLSTSDHIDLSGGNLLGADKLVSLSGQIAELAIATLTLSGNNFVDPDEKQMYNDVSV